MSMKSRSIGVLFPPQVETDRPKVSLVTVEGPKVKEPAGWREERAK